MTRISSLFVASTLAILPISAFAQQDNAPARPVAPTSMTTTQPHTATTPTDKLATDKTAVPGKTAATNVTQPAKPATKTTMHGANTVDPHNTKANLSTKPAEPSKS